MRIAIVGAGAMGCLFGGHLARAGQEVILVDLLVPTVEALRSRGVRLWEGEVAADVPVAATLDPGEAGPVDLVIVFVKALHTRSAAASLPPLLGPSTWVLTLQNGLGAAEELVAVVPTERLLVGVTAQGGTLLGPGEVRHGGSGATLLGPYRGDAAGARDVAAVLTAAGLPAEAVADPWPAVWRKLAINCGINALTALAGIRNGRIPEIPEAAAVLADAVCEAAAVAAAAGADPGDGEALARHVLDVARATAQNRSSMGQDVDRQVPTEIDFINGAVVREGKRLGIETPVNRTLTRLIKTLEATFPSARA